MGLAGDEDEVWSVALTRDCLHPFPLAPPSFPLSALGNVCRYFWDLEVLLVSNEESPGALPCTLQCPGQSQDRRDSPRRPTVQRPRRLPGAHLTLLFLSALLETLFPLDVSPQRQTVNRVQSSRYDCAPTTKASERTGEPVPCLFEYLS